MDQEIIGHKSRRIRLSKMSGCGGGRNAWTKTLASLAVLFVDITHAGSLLRQRAKEAAGNEKSLVISRHNTHHNTHHGQLRALGDGSQVVLEDDETANHISRGLGLNSYASWITEVENHEDDDLDNDGDFVDLTLDYTNYYKIAVDDEQEEEEETNSRFQNFYLRRSDNSDTFMSDVVPMSSSSKQNEMTEEEALNEIAKEEEAFEKAASSSSSWWWGSSIMGYMRGSNNVPTSDGEDTEEQHTAPTTSAPAPEETHYLKSPSTSTTKHSLCGNGQLDEGEECDDGEQLNGKNGHPCKKDCTSDHYVFDLSINVVNEDVEFYLVSGDASSIAMIDVLEDVGMLQDELRDRYDVGGVDVKSGKPVLGSGHPAKIDPNYTLYQYLDPAHCHRFVFWDEHVGTNDGLALRLKIDGAVVYDDETYRNNFEEGSSGGVKFGNCGED